MYYNLRQLLPEDFTNNPSASSDYSSQICDFINDEKQHVYFNDRSKGVFSEEDNHEKVELIATSNDMSAFGPNNNLIGICLTTAGLLNSVNQSFMDHYWTIAPFFCRIVDIKYL